MLWGLQSCQTKVSSERMWHFIEGRGILRPLLYIFRGSGPLQHRMIYAPDYGGQTGTAGVSAKAAAGSNIGQTIFLWWPYWWQSAWQTFGYRPLGRVQGRTHLGTNRGPWRKQPNTQRFDRRWQWMITPRSVRLANDRRSWKTKSGIQVFIWALGCWCYYSSVMGVLCSVLLPYHVSWFFHSNYYFIILLYCAEHRSGAQNDERLIDWLSYCLNNIYHLYDS